MSDAVVRDAIVGEGTEGDVEAALARLVTVVHHLDDLQAQVADDLAGLSQAVDSQITVVADDHPGPCAGLVLVPLQIVDDGRRGAWPAPLHRAAASRAAASPFLAHQPFLRQRVDVLGNTLRRSGRRLLGRGDPEAWAASAAEVWGLDDWSAKTGFSERLVEAVDLRRSAAVPVAPRGVIGVLADVLGLPEPQGSGLLEQVDSDLLGQAADRGGELLALRSELVQRVVETFAQVQEWMVGRRLREVTLEALREASGGQFRVRPLLDAGFENVQDVLDDPQALHSLTGLGRQSANAAHSAALDLRRRVQEDLRLRIDLDERDVLLTALVDGLARVLVFDAALDDHRRELEELVRTLSPLRGVLADRGGVLLLHRHSPRRGSDVAKHLRERARWLRASGLGAVLLRGRTTPDEAVHGWEDFKKRPIIFYGLLREIVGIDQDPASMQGHLSGEIVAAVERQRLDTGALSKDLQASLRAYQSFGARYALVQRRVLIGDEMGLGKTIQALAVMSHLAQQGRHHFVVVCPTAVVVNWIKEIRKHSDLRPVRAHGPDRQQGLDVWQRQGGVLITSHDTLRLLTIGVDPDLLVVDEAHVVKNPTTRRAAAVRAIVERSDRALYLTGTPIENKVEDFVNLVTQLRPDVMDGVDPAGMVLGARSFREAVAPVYLRRNAKDVLSELPDLVLNEDWLELTDSELDGYVDAVAGGKFHQVRQAAFLADPAGSQKMKRIEEIVDEARSNGLRVVIFSFYLEVLKEVHRRLGDRVVGVITGATAADDRQALVDGFGDRRAGVLLGQIGAAGTGLNIQAASVVILCEPQVKPSMEDQAIKRAHRMGQVSTVQVHRLLSSDSIDERMLELLAAKSLVFDTFAASSSVAEASPEATDMTESRLRQEVLAKEQERLADQIRGRHPQKIDTPTPSPDPNRGDRPRAGQAERPGGQLQICGSCDSRIDVLNHCRCSD